MLTSVNEIYGMLNTTLSSIYHILNGIYKDIKYEFSFDTKVKIVSYNLAR